MKTILASARACNFSVVVQRLCMETLESTAIQNNQKQQGNSSIVFLAQKFALQMSIYCTLQTKKQLKMYKQ